MTKKSSLKRVAHYAGALLLAGAVVGCGDDGDNNTDAGGGIDAGGVDATPCEGHGCGDIGSPFQLAEGGEFRLERLQYAAQGDFYLASQAFFFTSQEPAARPNGRPELVIPLRDEITALGYRCTDRRPGDLFENGASPEAQAIVDTREYYDVGPSVTLTNTDDDSVITLTKRMNEVDLSAHLTHDIVYRGPDDQEVVRNASYRPDITGSAEYPLLDLKYGESAITEELANVDTGVGDAQIFMPSTFQLTAPTEAQFFTPGFLTFTKGEDMQLEYTFEPAPESWPTTLLFVAFVNKQSQVIASCLKLPTADEPKPDNGVLLIPHEILTVAEQEEAGPVLIGRFTHAAWEEQEDKNRLDLLGIECKAAPVYTIQEPTGN